MGEGAPGTFLAILRRDAEASLTGGDGLPARWPRRGSVRGASLLIALLVALVAGLAGGSSARAAGGALTALSPASVAADEGPARVVVSPDGKSVYATNRGTTTVSQYSRNTETGKLTALSPATVAAGSSPEGIVVSPDGKNVYVAKPFLQDGLCSTSRDPVTGKLHRMSPATVAAGEEPIGVTISPEGNERVRGKFKVGDRLPVRTQYRNRQAHPVEPGDRAGGVQCPRHPRKPRRQECLRDELWLRALSRSTRATLKRGGSPS